MSETGVPTESAATDTTAIGIVSGAAYVSMLVSMVRSVLLARILGPVGRGVFNGVGLITQYCTHCNMGLVHGMNKLMPMWIGAGDRDGARRLQDTAFTATLLLTAATVGGILTLAFLVPTGITVDTRLGLALGAALLVMLQANLLVTSLLRTYGTYSLMGQSRLIACATEFVAVLGLGAICGAPGAVMGMVLSGLMSYLWILRGTDVRIRWRLGRDELRLLVGTGLPLVLLAVADQYYRTIDGLILLKVRHAYALGMYGIGLRLAAFLHNIPGAVGYVLFPRFLETYGREQDPAALRRLLLAPTLALVALLPLVAGVGFLMAGPFVGAVLPRFLPGLPAIRVLLLGGILLGVAAPTDAFLVAIGRHRRVIIHKALGGCIIAVSALLLSRSSLQLAPVLTYVAAAACVGYATTTALSLGLAFAHLKDSRAVWMLVRALVLGAYCVAVTIVAYWVCRQIPGPPDTWLKGGFGVAVVVLGSYPVLSYAQRETLVLSRLLGLARRFRP